MVKDIDFRCGICNTLTLVGWFNDERSTVVSNTRATPAPSFEDTLKTTDLGKPFYRLRLQLHGALMPDKTCTSPVKETDA